MSSPRPPAQPSYIFRGHGAAIHSVQILRRNTRLLTGDADGWVVLWKLESKRPVAVWRAHDAAILGTGEWLSDRVITHGRDNALRIWQLGAADEVNLSNLLPADGPDTHRPKPWLLHMLPVNTLNFCAFSMLPEQAASSTAVTYQHAPHSGLHDSVLVAVPARDDSKIELYRFPDEKLISVVPRVQHTETGMTMALKLVYQSSSRSIILIAGYEGGFTAVHRLGISPQASCQAPEQPMLEPVETIYLSRPHSQPILSLDASPSATVYFTSSADATIAAHRIPDKPLNIYDNENAPGDAGTGRSTEPLPVRQNATTGTDSAPSKPSGLSALFSKAASQPTVGAGIPKVNELTIQAPYKVVQTKHAGQQSLRVRSDGRLLVTAGWDSRVRIYSTKTLKEVAVLKWHKEGVYATDFAQILQSDDSTAENPHNQGGIAGTSDDLGASVQVEDTSLVQKRLGGLRRLQEQREAQMQAAHWVVAGAKDGKVSLWEVF